MKRLFLLSIFFTFLLFSCKQFTQDYFVAISVDSDENVKFIDSSQTLDTHHETTVGATIHCSYRLIPDTDKTINVESYFSTNEAVIEILEHDAGAKTITAIAKSKGTGKITITTKDFYSSTTLPIIVK